jgi:hypothetical protein
MPAPPRFSVVVPLYAPAFGIPFIAGSIPLPAARLSIVSLRIAGVVLIVAAIALVRAAPTWARGVYRIGIGCTDVAGYCIERGFARPFRCIDAPSGVLQKN